MARINPVKIAIIADAKQAAAAFNQTATNAKTFGDRVKGVIKGVSVAGAAAGLAVVGYSLKKGFERLNNLDTAKTKLKALGFSAKETQGLMDSALKSVKGTAFGLDEAATAGANAAAAGVKQGAEMDRYLKMVADTAAVSGRSMTDMGAIINKVQTNQKVTQREINQINDAGIAISSKLAEHYGVSGAELSKMVAAGKVDAKTFNKVLGDMTNDAAKTMGETLPAKIANISAALGRIGAAFLETVFPALKGGADKIQGLLDKVEDKAGDVAEKFNEYLGRIKDWLSQVNLTELAAKFEELKSKAVAAFEGIRDAIEPLGNTFSNVWELAGPLVEGVGKLVIGAGWALLAGALDLIASAAEPVAKKLETITGWAADNKKGLGITAGIIGTLLAPAIIGLGIAAAISGAQAAVSAGAWLAYGLVVKGMAIVTNIVTAAQWLWNAAMLANPITWIVMAIVALIAIIVLLVMHWDTVTAAITKAWDWIKTKTAGAITAIKDYITGLWSTAKQKLGDLKNTIIDALKNGWQAAKNAAVEKVASLISWVKGIPGRIRSALGDARTMLSGVGKRIISGLIDGIKGKFQDVRDTLGSLTDKIPSWKGPARRDAGLLKPAATLIMDGLINQIESKRRDLRATLKNVTEDVSRWSADSPTVGGQFELTSAAAAGRYGTTSITVNVDVPVGANRYEIGREIAGALDAYYRIGGRR